MRPDLIIEELMKEHGLTYYGIAKISGIHKNTVGHWKCRRSIPNVVAFNRLLGSFGYELKVVKK
jgi:transcriptional regulator with XRE-family HTH domain